MKRAIHLSLAVVFVVSMGGCRDGLPTEPRQMPSPRTEGSVYGTVYTPEGACLTGAAVELVDASGQSWRVEQSATKCVGVDMDGFFDAFSFGPLPMGSAVRIRASKAGFEPREIPSTVVDCCFVTDSLRITLTPSK